MRPQWRANPQIGEPVATGAALSLILDVYPNSLTLVPGTTRQLKVHVTDPNTGLNADVHEANQTAFAGTPETIETYEDPDTGETTTYVYAAVPAVFSGTRYSVSDDSIARVSDNGLITALRSGSVTVSVVHLGSVVDAYGNVSEQVIGQSDIQLTVQVAQITDNDPTTATPQTILVNAQEGAVISAETGETVLIGQGALKQDSPVSIRRIDLNAVDPATVPFAAQPGGLEAVGAFTLDIGATASTYPLQLAIPVQTGNVQAGDEVWFLRKGQVIAPGSTADNLIYQDTWWVVDNGFIGFDDNGNAIAKTASPPYSGAVESGEYQVYKKLPGVIGSTFELIVGAGDSMTFGGTSGLSLSFGGGLLGRAITAEMIGIVATMSTTGTAASYHFGVPQFADIDIPTANEPPVINTSAKLPPVVTPYGNVVVPNITDASVSEAGIFTITIDNENPGELLGKGIVLRALFADGSHQDIKKFSGDTNGVVVISASDLNTVAENGQESKAFAVGSVGWQLVRVIPGYLAGGDDIEFAGNTLRLTPKADMAATLTRTGIEFYRQNKTVGQVNLVNRIGTGQPIGFDGAYLSGNKVQPIAFSTDLSRAYVAGKGVVYEIDLLTFQLIDTLVIPGGKNIVSLASVGSLLIAGEGQSYGNGSGNNQLYAMDTNPGSSTYNTFRSIQGTGPSASLLAGIEHSSLGVAGMTVGPDGQTLVVAVPKAANSFSIDPGAEPGDILVLDFNTFNFATGVIKNIVKASLPGDSRSGKTPQVITATKDENRYLVANVSDYNRGLSTLTLSRDDHGTVTGAKLEAISLSQPDNKIFIDRLDIQRAQSAVLVEQDGVEYAIVADDNYHFFDPYWKAMYEAPTFVYTPSGPPIAVGGSASAKKVAVGGKLGIVKDPFGQQGSPEYLGATLPLDGYGIVNLSLSEDGNVLIGQLKGSYSGNILSEESLIQKPSQSHAWDVKALIDAALNQTDQDRLRKHISLSATPNAEQNIASPGSEFKGTLGTAFDPEWINASVEGRMGDVIGVDLKELAARQLLVREGLLTEAKAKLPWEQLSAADWMLITQRAKDLSNFSVDSQLFNFFTGQLAQEPPLKLLTDPGGHTLVSRQSADAGNALSLESADFKDSGILFFVPNITETATTTGGRSDLDKLRAGETLADKFAGLIFYFTDRQQAADDPEPGKGLVTVTAKDYAPAANAFVGDRPLDNPGYSVFQLKGGVDTSSTNLLDIARVEQRLKYLGFAATDNTSGKPMAEIAVDGQWNAQEQQALKLFETVVRYTSAIGTGQDDSHSVEIQYRATVTTSGADGKTVDLQEVPGSFKRLSTNSPTQSQINAARAVAKQNALHAAGYQSQADLNGIDGSLEADADNAQRSASLGWLNAYNAPHWLQFFASLDTGYQTNNARLGSNSWANQQTGGAQGSNVFGTSWVFDLMVASQQVNQIPLMDVVPRPNGLQFAGTGPLGVALNLGINSAYISKATAESGIGNQDRVNGKDIILGLLPDKNKDSEVAAMNDTAAYKNQQWDLGNAQRLAGLLLNNYDPATQQYGATPNNTSGLNQQDQALLDFLAVYSTTQKGEHDGGWNSINIVNSDADKIRAALFGDGSQVNGVIDENRILLGGTAATVGSMMTGESLKKIMGNDKSVEWNQLWVEPLQKAMDEFNINTPQRIAAFLAQVRHESGGLAALGELGGKYKVSLLLSTYHGVFYPNKPNDADQAANPYKAGSIVVGKLLTDRAEDTENIVLTDKQATFLNLKSFVKNDLHRNDLDGVSMNGENVIYTATGANADDARVKLPTEELKNIFFDRYLSEDVGNGEAGNGTLADKVAHNWKGRGLIQMTHKGPYEKFANYIQTFHGDLIAEAPGKTKAETLLADTKQIIDIENNPNSRMLAALSGAWFWGTYKNINPKADLLNFDPANQSEQAKFNAVSQKINGDDALATRWDIYRGEVTPKILTGGNPYEDMADALKQLGMATVGTQGYETKFGINLAKRTVVEIGDSSHQLTANMSASTLPYVDKVQALLVQAQQALNLRYGEFTMWISDMPIQQIEPPAIYLAANTQAGQTGGTDVTHKLGVCRVVYGSADIVPTGHAEDYLSEYMPKDFKFDFSPAGSSQIDNSVKNFDFENYPNGSVRPDTAVRIVEQPKHGRLVQTYPEATDYEKYHYKYISDTGFTDFDHFVVEVSGGGITVQIYYTVSVLDPEEPRTAVQDDGKVVPYDTTSCPQDYWKISIAPNATPTDGAYSLSLPTAFLGDDYTSPAVTFANLPGAAVGETQGSGANASITLDTNAAGHGWYIDYTPYLNDGFLPTSNPNEWVAKAGSDAAGKMDLLSVLLHEYGHALGLEHSADAHDFMGTTLPPGMRRLPSSDELALMAQLVAEAKQNLAGSDSTVLTDSGSAPSPIPTLPLGAGFGISFLGLTRRNNSGSRLFANAPVQYTIAANPALVSGKLESADGWETTGNVAVNPSAGSGQAGGEAVLSEVAGSQTRLNQVFVLGEHDRFLSFTLAAALGDQADGPDDAFEAALLDANTGVSLLGATDLSRNDAFLNRQANGEEHVASGITRIDNADGSRTYLVDLGGIAAGTAVNLSFDLIGFGQGSDASNSQITVRDLRLGVPQTADDSVTLAEDAPTVINALANDINAFQPSFVPVIVNAPSHGQVAINADGSFSFTPEQDWYGEDTFTYKLSDSRVDSNLATVTLTVTPVNDAPVAADSAVTLAEDTPFTIDLLALAGDVEGDALVSAIVNGPAHGSLIQNTDGSYTYTPDANYNGTDSFSYKVNDGSLDSNLATVTLNITPVNDAPTAGDQQMTTDEDTPVTGSLLAVAADIDSAVLQGSIVVGPQHGQISVATDGSFTYLADANYNGADSFTYKVNDGELDSTIATVSLVVNAVNDAPTAGDQSLSINEDTPITGSLLAVAADIDSAILQGSIVVGPQHGLVTVAADGSFTYLADANYNGADSFTYKVNDGELDSAIATVMLTIVPVNDAPTAGDQSLTTDEDTPVTGSLLAVAADIDSALLQGSIVVGPQHGQVSVVADGSFTYLADANYNGADSFTYKVNDGELDSTIATVSLVVNAVNDAPTAGDQQLTTNEDTPITGSLLAVAADIDSALLQGSIIVGPQHGQVNVAADGSFTYTPDANYNGADSFTYKVNDGELDSTIATVMLTILPVNDAPVVSPIAATLLEDGVITLNLLGSAGDVDGDPLTVTVGTPQHGQLVKNDDGSYTYLPDANYNGEDSFHYAVSDGQLNSGPALVRLTITAVNDAPVAQDDTATVDEDHRIQLAIMANDIDIDSAHLNVIIVEPPVHGTLIVNADNTVSYTPLANWSGEDSFSYKLNDGPSTSLRASLLSTSLGTGLDSGIATVRLIVNPVADAPALVLSEVGGARRELFRTGWDSVSNRNTHSTLLEQRELEGWIFVARPKQHHDEHDDHDDHHDEHGSFEIWSTGDKMRDAQGRRQIVTAVNGSSGNWLELNSAKGEASPERSRRDHETLGIERRIDTVAGATYTLSLDLSGHLGYSADTTRIGIYLDGVKIGGDESTSPGSTLNWQSRIFQFTGTGGAQTLRIVSEASRREPNGRGMMLDNIALTETLQANTGFEDSAIPLSAIGALLRDTDGSETLTLTIGAIPVGATLTDGVNRFTATLDHATVEVTGWNLSKLTILPAQDFNGQFTLKIIATSTESANRSQASSEADLQVTVLAVNDAPLAESARYTLSEGGSIVIDFAGLIHDVDGDVLTLSFSNPKKGSLTKNADGTYTYTPKRGFTGTETIGFTVSDGQLTTTAGIALIVLPKDDEEDHCQHDNGSHRGFDHSEHYGYQSHDERSARLIVQSTLAADVAQNNDQEKLNRQSSRPVSLVDWTGQTPNLGKLKKDDWVAELLTDRPKEQSLAELTGLLVKMVK
jgi:VCBS repeat-containing protein